MSGTNRYRGIASTVAEELASQNSARAVLLVGSTAVGYADEHSDVDLHVVGSIDAGERSVNGVHVEWTPLTLSELNETLAGWTDDAALYTYSNAEILYDEAEVTEILDSYTQYPPGIRKQKLYAGWFYGTGDALDARKADRRDDQRLTRCAAVMAVKQFAALTYVLDGQFPPYRTWLFHDLPMELPALDAALDGDIEAIDAIADTIESNLKEHLNHDRIDAPYLYQPSFERLG